MFGDELMGLIVEVGGQLHSVGSHDLQFLRRERGLFRGFLLWKLRRRYFRLRWFAANEVADLFYQAAYRLKWLSQGIVRAYSARLRFIERLKRANQKHNGNMLQLFTSFNIFADFIAVEYRHKHVCQHHVGE